MPDEMLACRRNLPALGQFRRERNELKFVSVPQPDFAHAGLVLSRCLPCHDKESEGKKQTFGAAREALRRLARPGGDSIYSLLHERWLQTAKGTCGCSFSLATPAGARLIVGLGNESPLETGLTLHHTYGVPIIPGSALKGLTAHFCDQVLGQADPTLRQNYKTVQQDAQGREVVEYGAHQLLFGDTDSSGFIVFHDAWIDPASLAQEGEGLLLDVMTPHHGDYYGDKRYDCKGQPLQDQLIPPTDFDDPIPVQFLSVRGTFHFALSWNDGAPLPLEEAKQRADWLAFAKSVLVTALDDWGVGGKTSSGYGRLVDPTLSKPVVTIDASAAAISRVNPAKSSASAGKSAESRKRPCNTPTRVKIVGTRPKGGYTVQEEGKSQGTLTIGSPPSGIDIAVGESYDVLVHVDDSKSPQYKWAPSPSMSKSAGKKGK